MHRALGNEADQRTSMKFDNPEARLVHDYPPDTAQFEVKDMIKEADNTGHAWPQV
jgi:uncharacterized protein